MFSHRYILRGQALIFYFMVLLVRLVRVSNNYYCDIFNILTGQKRDVNRQQSQILSPATQGCALLVPCANIMMCSALSSYLLTS